MTLNVIKIGGSLSQNTEALQQLCQKLNSLADKHQIVIVPGGGKFADYVREADKQFNLSETTTHHMAILAMDQYGLLLTNLIPNSKTITTIEEAKKAHTKIVVLLSSNLAFLYEELPNSWEVTSDSIAACIAEKLEAEKLLLIKDVDGIFTDDPKNTKQTKLIKHLTTNEFSEIKNKTCTDTHLSKLLKKQKINCYIINGLYPDRIEATLKNQKTTNTTITP